MRKINYLFLDFTGCSRTDVNTRLNSIYEFLNSELNEMFENITQGNNFYCYLEFAIVNDVMRSINKQNREIVLFISLN